MLLSKEGTAFHKWVPLFSIILLPNVFCLAFDNVYFDKRHIYINFHLLRSNLKYSWKFIIIMMNMLHEV